MRNENEIKKYIIEEFLPDSSLDDLDSDMNLVETGIIDSLGVLKLVSAFEYELDLVIEPEELDVDNFSSINSMLALIQLKKSLSET